MNKSGTFETPLNTKVPPENKAIGEGDITDLTQKRYEQDTRWRSRLSLGGLLSLIVHGSVQL